MNYAKKKCHRNSEKTEISPNRIRISDICQQMEKAFSQSNFEGCVVSGIQAVTQQLVKHFPANEHSRNELPNKPVVL